MAKRINVFYAYPSNPPMIGECINQAIDDLKSEPLIRQRNVRFRPWTSMEIGGKLLISTVTQNIGRADIFACDLTYPNFNVTFELGFAIARFKRIWPSLNASIENAPGDFKRIYSGMLGGLGYSSYVNFKNLVDYFVSSPPWVDLDATPLGLIYRNRPPLQEQPTLFYVKPIIDTDAVIRTSEVVSSSTFRNSVIVDDPKEDPSPTLEWYGSKIRSADAVLVQLLASDQVNSNDHNFRCAFTAGLAYGFGKPLLMVAPSPYDPPTDYQNLLKLHETSQLCKNLVETWIDSLTITRRRRRRPTPETTKDKKVDLRAITIGESVAENEQWSLDDYFVETSAYYRALERPTTILVGRRGTGKSANLYAIRATLSRDKRNHVCVIKPVGYEIDGLIRVLNENLDRSERGYLIESLWKYLVFSELAMSVFAEISSRPPYSTLTMDEQKFIEYVTERKDRISVPFSERLDKAVGSLGGIGELPDAIQQRQRISELLHSGEIRELRELLGLVLSGRLKVAILIDNLDEPWTPSRDINRLSELLLGLLSVVEDVSDEFQHQDHWRRRVNVSVTLLLRSDIYAVIQPQAAEQDKLPIERIIWDDPEVLIKLLNQRLQYAGSSMVDLDTIWEQLFPQEVVGISTSEFITSTILSRPRDIIYLVKAAIDGAVNRGHESVTAQDFLDARERYSEFAFRSVLAEDDPRKGKLEAVLFEFAGAPKTLTLAQVRSRIAQAGVKKEDVEFYVDLLCDLSFLGIETATHEFRYSRHEGEREMLRRVARQFAVNPEWGEESHEINAAFHQVLQIG